MWPLLSLPTAEKQLRTFVTRRPNNYNDLLLGLSKKSVIQLEQVQKAVTEEQKSSLYLCCTVPVLAVIFRIDGKRCFTNIFMDLALTVLLTCCQNISVVGLLEPCTYVKQCW